MKPCASRSIAKYIKVRQRQEGPHSGTIWACYNLNGWKCPTSKTASGYEYNLIGVNGSISYRRLGRHKTNYFTPTNIGGYIANYKYFNGGTSRCYILDETYCDFTPRECEVLGGGSFEAG